MSQRPLKTWLAPRTGAAELAEIHARIAGRRDRPAATPLGWAMTLVAATALGVWGWSSRSTVPSSACGRYEVRASAVVPEVVRLDDGSEIVVLPGGQLAVESEDRVRLLRGRATFAIAHPRRQAFEVHAGEAQVTVLGTRFLVGWDEDRLEVIVDEGRVRVAGLERPGEVGAGERRTWAPDPRLDAGDASPSHHPSVEPIADPDAHRGEAPPTASHDDRRAPDSGVWPHVQHTAEARRVPGSATTTASPEPAAAPEPIPLDEDVVGALLARADLAREAGNADEAEAAWRRVLTEHRDDPRAGMASFLLARSLLEVRRDPAAAVVALDEALTLGLPEALHETVRARQVEAWVSAGDRHRAREAARAYLRHHPHGRRAEDVKTWAR